MGGPILWAVKTVLQILSYVAGVFWLIDVLKTFLKKSRGPGQNIQINMADRAFSETKWKSGQTWKIGKIGARSELHQKKLKNLGNI